MTGYRKCARGTSPPDPLELRVLDARKGRFTLLTPFVYVDKAGTTHEVPGIETDLASVPWPLRGLIGSYGRHLRAALLHDHQCEQARDAGDPDAAYAARRRADELFRETLRDAGDGARQRVSRPRTVVLWAGVSFGRYLEFRRGRAAIVALQAVAGTSGVYLVLGKRDPRWLLLYALAIVAAAAWGADAAFVAWSVAVAPLVLPPLVATLVAAGVLAAFEVIPWARDRDSEPSPDPRPTLGG